MASIQQTAQLVGVVPKNGSGTLDNGTAWSTDRVELHCLIPLDETKGAKGMTSQIFKIQGCDANRDRAFALIGQNIVVELDLVAGNPGQAPKLNPKTFRALAGKTGEVGKSA